MSQMYKLDIINTNILVIFHDNKVKLLPLEGEQGKC